MMESERWDDELIRSLQGTPQQPDPRRKGITVPISFKFEDKAVDAPVQTTKEFAEPSARRRGITRADLENTV